MAAIGGRWWPDRRPPRSSHGVFLGRKKGQQFDKQIPNPPSADPVVPRRDNRGAWAPQPGGQVVRGAGGSLIWMPNRAEPAEWKEPRRRLLFPKATPKVAATDKENRAGAVPAGKDLFGAKASKQEGTADGMGRARGLKAQRPNGAAAPQLRTAADIAAAQQRQMAAQQRQMTDVVAAPVATAVPLATVSAVAAVSAVAPPAAASKPAPDRPLVPADKQPIGAPHDDDSSSCVIS